MNRNKWYTRTLAAVLAVSLCFMAILGHQWWNKRVDDKALQMQTVKAADVSDEEMRAVWISYLEFQSAGMSKMNAAKFKKYIDNMFTKCVKLKMNTVIVQVRPFGDALYSSKYFPWSSIASGKQGRNPGYDPLAYMVQAAHQRGLQIHAWLNPYRVTLSNMKVSSLAKDNVARKWLHSSQKDKKRNVLKFDGMYYYNPAKEDVQTLIVNGIKEIVENYDVDGIHFDDYFYPTLGSQYKTNFDGKEYQAYKKKCKRQGIKAKSIVSWRRENVNTLLQKTYQEIKNIKENVVFGVSPAGNIDNLYAKDRYYCDVKKWMNSTGYIDYICPQIYWSFTHKVCPYKKTTKRWASLKQNENVDLYIGLAAYRAGSTRREAAQMADYGWSAHRNQLAQQVRYARQYKKINGFILFRYDNLVSKKAKTEILNLKKVL